MAGSRQVRLNKNKRHRIRSHLKKSKYRCSKPLLTSVKSFNMAAIGPSLPPHLLAKRKRAQEEPESVLIEPPIPSPSSGSDKSPQTGKTPLPAPGSSSLKRRKVLGPSLPPAPLDERPTSPLQPQPISSVENDSDSDSDSSLGPTLPSAISNHDEMHDASTSLAEEVIPNAGAALERPDWMLRPPSPTSWTSRIDTTKLRSRKFATGKPSNPAPARDTGGISETWTETVAQKQQRLQDEVLGVKAPSALGEGVAEQERKRKKQLKEEEKRRREAGEKGPSLYERHQNKAGVKEKEDDPSARAFDREKDIAGGMKIGHGKRKELLRNAKGFGGRFEGGGVL